MEVRLWGVQRLDFLRRFLRYYEYCVSVASGAGTVAYKIARGKTANQSAAVKSGIVIGSRHLVLLRRLAQTPGQSGCRDDHRNADLHAHGGKPEKSLSTRLLLE